jgi:DNA-binding winged helix-turn-helix (wHTH) protein
LLSRSEAVWFEWTVWQSGSIHPRALELRRGEYIVSKDVGALHTGAREDRAQRGGEARASGPESDRLVCDFKRRNQMQMSETSFQPVRKVVISRGQEFIFGSFRLVPQRRTLLRDGVPIRLRGCAREILLALVERAGEIVTKRELMTRVWPDAFVEEATLRVHIAILRRALADGPFGIRYVETINGRGYCFVAPVTRIEVDPTGSDEAVSAD